MNISVQEVQETPSASGYGKAVTPHDEAFKKLLHTFFAEFIELFFPELHKLLDYRQTRFLMQEQLVDIVGEEKRTLDLLLETKYKQSDAFILLHLEPQSFRQQDFHERMFIYFGRLFERHRKEHRLIIPIAIFTADDARNERNSLHMAIPGHEILHFQFLKVELRQSNWRRFVDSNNPVAAALLAKMGYNKGEEKEIRLSYLRMILQLRKKLDDARLALVMSIADLYFVPDPTEDEAMLRELTEQFPEERESIMELMPAWSRAGYEKGIEEGREKGILQGLEQGLEKGIKSERRNIARKLISKGFSPEEVADALDLPVDEINNLMN
ncbi:Rpn family recombination-promoting nuclease/putative transposase [Paenibacillus sp. M1]|uniref:Rpn family recombination-promoting nuclease/putative transposase n=1 Tax=Paenibacillus haidiansis TaxID=1574488 RepID=A0ABU7VT08_9BACL